MSPQAREPRRKRRRTEQERMDAEDELAAARDEREGVPTEASQDAVLSFKLRFVQDDLSSQGSQPIQERPKLKFVSDKDEAAEVVGGPSGDIWLAFFEGEIDKEELWGRITKANQHCDHGWLYFMALCRCDMATDSQMSSCMQTVNGVFRSFYAMDLADLAVEKEQVASVAV